MKLYPAFNNVVKKQKIKNRVFFSTKRKLNHDLTSASSLSVQWADFHLTEGNVRALLKKNSPVSYGLKNPNGSLNQQK